MNSAIYKGKVRHRRYRPTLHEFSYDLFMFMLDLDELDDVLSKFRFFGSGRFAPARFFRPDYIGRDDQPLKEAVLEKMNSLSEQKLDGSVFLVGQVRTLGLYFSPLNVYYLKQGDEFTHMLAEVSNTPWNERHYYLVDISDPKPHRKAFHVSPFNPMSQKYHWRIKPPGRGLLLHIESHEEQIVFDATMALRRYPLNQKEINRVLIRKPVQTLSVVSAIYWHALKLILKKVPLHAHPRKELA